MSKDNNNIVSVQRQMSDSDEDSWELQQQAKTTTRSDMGKRGNSKEENNQSRVSRQQETKSQNNANLDESVWSGKHEKTEEKNEFPQRGNKIETSFITEELANESSGNELKSDDVDTSWAQDIKEQKEKTPQRRGNRNQEGTGRGRGGDTRCNREYQGGPRRGNREREYDRSDNRDNHGRGRGQYRGGRGDYGGGRGDYGGGFNKKRGAFEHRDNEDDRQNNYRGDRGPRRGGQGNNYYRNNDNRSNNYNNGGNRGGYTQKTRDSQNEEDNRSQRSQNTRNYNQTNDYSKNNPNNQPRYQEPPQHTNQPKKPEAIIPKGRKCWPQSCLYILGCKLSVTYRPMSDFRCKLLVLPYSTIKMEYFPGNIINRSSVNYKQKIVNKGELISTPGTVYMQKAIDLDHLQAIAFLKVDPQDPQNSMKVGTKEVLKMVQKLKTGTEIDSIIFPICTALGPPASVIETLLTNLENCSKIKQVYVTTNSSQCFVKAMNEFTQQMQTLIEDNQILFD